MYIYLIVFLCSLICIILSEHQHNKWLKNILIIVALMLPSILAGFRSEIIGTDFLTYVKPLFDLASQSENFFNFLNLPLFRTWRYVSVSTIEPGYLLLTYFVAKTFHSIIVLNFIISMIITGLVYLGLLKLKKHVSNISISFGMLTYYLFFFNGSLNAIRQYIAMAIVFFGFHYIIEKNFLKYLLIVLIATLFHRTLIISIIFYFIYVMMESEVKIVYSSENNKFWYLRNILFIVLIISFILLIINPKLFQPVFQFFGLDDYANVYLKGTFKFSISYFLFSLPLLMILFINKRILCSNNIFRFLFVVSLLYIFMTQLASYSPYAIRIADIFAMYNIYLFAIISSIDKNMLKNIIYRLILCVYMLGYWYIFYGWMNSGQTIPYVGII